MENNDVPASVSTYDPADRLFGDNQPTVGQKKKEAKLSIGKRVGIFLFGLTLLAVSAETLVDTFFEETHHVYECKNFKSREADIPNSFRGGINAWEKSGGKVIHSICGAG
jgi:hypothetical protein